MDALIAAFAAILLAHADGHPGGRANECADGWGQIAVTGAIAAAIAGAAASGGVWANGALGQGLLNLLLALSLASAAVGLGWRTFGRPAPPVTGPPAGVMRRAVRTAAALLAGPLAGLCFGLAATSGAGEWTAAGALAALMLVALAAPPLRRWGSAPLARWTSGAAIVLLLGWAGAAVRVAFGV